MKGLNLFEINYQVLLKIHLKSGLEDFLNKCVCLGLSGQGNFWEAY